MLRVVVRVGVLRRGAGGDRGGGDRGEGDRGGEAGVEVDASPAMARGVAGVRGRGRWKGGRRRRAIRFCAKFQQLAIRQIRSHFVAC
jgi:hypothetical protein